MSSSVKHRFLQNSNLDEIDSQDSIIEVERIAYNPNDTANTVHRSLAKLRLLRGGLGSGKTRCGTEHINALCLQYPGALCLIGRKDITSLKVTTQKEFLEKVVPPEAVATFNVNENNLYYKNGSMVIFRETKDPDKVLSLELTAFMLDEANENDNPEVVDKLRGRLRQKIYMDGDWVEPPYAGLLVFNPPGKNHWLYHLSKEWGVEDIQFSTYTNAKNLPESYIPDLERRLPPWERKRLLDGDWGIEVKGKPVIYGFTEENNVRYLNPIQTRPGIRTWDFGYGHPAVKLSQFDPQTGRYFILSEMLGEKEKLNFFAPKAILMSNERFGPGFPIVDYCDPHGADEKDLATSSVEYLRIHHGIHCNYKRQRIKTGMEEIQNKVISKGPKSEDDLSLESLFLVDRRCTITIAAYTYGYHQDEFGKPVKDGYFDHLVDCDRYGIVSTMNQHLSLKRPQQKYRPRNRLTGY